MAVLAQPPMPFVVGVARSGTTLLRLMLDAHSELAIPHETHFVPAVLRELPVDRESFFRKLTEFPTWEDLKTPADRFWEELSRVEPFDVPGGLRAFYRLYAGARGKRRWGDKTPPYCLHIRAIQEALPEARFIHILRDGRDVALSLRHLWFSPGTDMEALATQWVRHIATARQQGRENPFYLEVRYEDLVGNPGSELRRVCDFIGLEYEPGMERYHETARLRLEEVETRRDADGRVVITKDERLHLHRYTSLPPQGSRIGRWRTEMTRDMLAAYEEIAGDLLADLGYERAIRKRRWFSRWFTWTSRFTAA